jgi:rhodanese-related sulfurtransferase
MSKHRKKSVAAPKIGPVQSSSPLASRPDSRMRRMIWQLAGLLGASVVLGFAFNLSSPLGIQFNDANSNPLRSTEVKTEASPTSTVMLPPAPQPTENPAVKQSIVLPPPPTPTVERQMVTRQLTPAAPVAPPIAAPPMASPPVVVSPPATAAAQNPAAIHWAEAKPLAASGQAVLVDVRHKSMYDAGHIPGAISLPETSTPEEFTAFLNQHPTNLTLIVYCSSTSCSQSARVAGRLVTQYQRPSVKYMTGGYMEYQQMELANQPAQPKP